MKKRIAERIWPMAAGFHFDHEEAVHMPATHVLDLFSCRDTPMIHGVDFG